MAYVSARFVLDPYTVDMLRDMEPEWGYDGFGEFIFMRTYSRIDRDGKQEGWADVCIRCVEGVMSIRKDYYIKNMIPWNETEWQDIAKAMAHSMFKMMWLPPGRGLWAMGTDFIYERGAMALYNCSYTTLCFKSLDEDLSWMMDSLMLGVGVGFSPIREEEYIFKLPRGSYEFMVPDSREGWVEGLKRLMQAYAYGASKPIFRFDEVREAGAPIKGFGGISSGPEPLRKLYQFCEEKIDQYMRDPDYDSVLLKADIANQIGCCVVAGNVRRSAELACLDINDPTFKHLKDYKRFPEREMWGWMSNNSSILKKNRDFERLGELAAANRNRSDLGYLNLRNFGVGRIGKRDKVRWDAATGANPCAEITLENKEVCNVDDTFPTKCDGAEDWYDACRWATIYCSTVSLLPTHQPETNKVVARNRRIGVGICGVTSWINNIGMSKVTKYLRRGYKVVREMNKIVNGEAGVPESIRVTTVKPNGTTSKLVGVTPGVGYPNFHYMIRRVRVARNSAIHGLLALANVPYENDWVSKNTDVFEFPIKMDEEVKEVGDVSVWEQAMNLVLLQREWADNSVSNTLMFRPKWILLREIKEAVEEEISEWINDLGYRDLGIMGSLYTLDEWHDNQYKVVIKWDKEFEEFEGGWIYKYDPKNEEDDLEAILAAIAPVTKTVSMLPHTAQGVYVQMPEEGITKNEYLERKARIKKIDWSLFNGSDGIDEKFCSNDSCVI